MGGKTKTSQRTKNNARPSSSGRSAELLNNSAKGEQYLAVGHGAVPVLFPSLATISIDQGLSAEYSVCFKKFNKKDPVTKTKALQELTELVKTGNVEDAEAALSSWSHHYQLLTIHSDRRVREAAQACHGAVMSACGRRAAPQLRRLLPVWLLALHDEHAPAASYAQTALQNTFPEGKLPEALQFCKSEILTLLRDNLTGNAEAMVGKRIEDEEEKKLQVSRVLASSLHALRLFVSQLPRAHADWLWEACVAPLLQHNYFWGLARSQSQPIRAAWYGAMSQVIEQFGSRMPLQVGKKAAKALVAEPERNAGVAAQRWTALLLLMRHVAEWHLWLEKKDLLVTRLLDMIENGAWGEARLLSSMLVPLLTSLPQDLLTKQFYIKFFDAMFTGLNNKNLLNSKSERQTWISNISECVRHLSTQNHEFVVEVITYVHRTWLERVLTVKDSQARTNMIRHSMTNMSSLIKYWLNRSKDESEKYDQLTRNFWQNTCSTILTQIDKLSIEREDITQSVEVHILLLKTLQTSFLNEPKKKMSIQFEDQKLLTIDERTIEKIDVSCDEQVKERFKHNLNDLVQKTCCSYFDFAYKKQVSQSVCPVLTNLLIEFDSRDLFTAVARHFGAESAYGFYDRVLRPWLAGDTMRCKALVEMVFLVVKYLSEEEQDSMFGSFQQFPPPVVEWCIQLTLSHPHSQLPAGKRWMRGPVVEASVLSLCKREEDTKARSLLLTCLAHDETGDVIVSESSVGRVVQALCERLESARGAQAQRVHTAAELAAALAGGAARALAGPLLRALFRHRLRLARDGEQHATVFSSAVWDAWRDALPALPASRRAELLAHALRDICDYLFDDIRELDVKRIENAASFCPYLFCTSEDKTSVTDVVSLAKELFTHIETKQPKTPLELYALRCDCIHGNIIPAFERNNELYDKIESTSSENHEELTKDDLMISVYKSLFRMYFLRKITQNISGDDEESKSWCNLLLTDPHFTEEFSRVLYDYAVMNTLYDYYAFSPNYEIIYQAKNQMKSLLEDIITDITIETKDAIYSFSTESFDKKGFYWPFARKLFDITFNEVTAKVRERQNKTTENLIESQEHSQLEQESDYVHNDEEISVSKIEQKVSEHNSEQKLDGELLQRGDENTLTIEKSCVPEQGSSVVHSGQSSSKTVIEQDVSEPESDQKRKECISEEKNYESKLNQSKSESISEQSMYKPEHGDRNPKSESSLATPKLEQSTTESRSELAKVHTHFAHVDDERWKELLGFPSLEEVIANRAYYLDLQAEAKYSRDGQRPLRSRFAVMMRSVFGAHARELELLVQLLADLLSVRGEPHSPDPVINGYYKRNHLMLFERELTDAPWRRILSNVAVVDYLSEAVAQRGRSLPASHWDFVNIALSSLLDSVRLSARRWGTTNVSALLRAATRLCARVHGFMRALRCSATAPPAPLAALLAEWDDIFAPDVNRHLFAVLLAVLRSTDTPVTASSVSTIGSLIDATQYMEWEALRSASGAAGLSMEAVAEAAIGALVGMNHHAYKYLAFHTLQLMAKPLVFQDAQRLSEWNAEEGGEKPRPANCLALFDDAVLQLQDYTEAALANVQLCEGTCEMVPFSDSHCVSLGYLLLAAAFLRLCAHARGDLHHVYTAEFRERKYAEGLMSCSLRLLPGAAADFAYVRGAALAADALQCFQRLPDLDVYARCTGSGLGALACCVLTETLGGPGAACARSWASAAPARVGAALRRLVPAAVTPVLLQRHLRQLKQRAHELPDARVSIQWSRGEVQCRLAVEDHELELAVRFAPDHPLSPPAVSAPPASPTPDTSWLVLYLAYQVSIQWSRGEVQCRLAVEDHELELAVRFAPDHPLSPPAVSAPPASPTPDTSWLVLYLAYQNGTLLNALKMWVRAVNSRVQSAAQCYVCYCRMHPASGRFPHVPCHQCRNKFHGECLNKWFLHSKKTNCPLCRAKL